MALNLQESNLPRLVIIGGGFAGLTVSRRLKKADLQIVLIDRNNFHTFQPLLYQVATAGLEPDSVAYPLRKIFQKHKNLVFRMADVLSIVPERNEVITTIGPIKYDYLLIATGSETNYFGIPSLEDRVMSLKSIPDALDLRSLILERFEKALLVEDISSRDELMTFVVVGGGPTGVETAGALGELKKHILPTDFPELDLRRMQIHLVEASTRLLIGMSENSSEAALKFLKRIGVTVWFNSPVKFYDGSTVRLGNDKDILAGTVIWSAGVLGAPPKGFASESLTKGQRIKVDRFNRVNGLENVFAIGDVACMETEKYPGGHPMVAQVAIQQARLFAKNLGRLQRGDSLTPFEYRDMGTMATIGRNRAVAEFPRIKFKGLFAWFIWMNLHLLFLIGFRNKMVVLINWMWNYITYDRGVRLILSRFRSQGTTTGLELGGHEPASQGEEHLTNAGKNPPSVTS